MKRLILFLILAFFILPLSSAVNYKVDMNYSNQEASISSVSIDYFSKQIDLSGNFSIIIKDKLKNELYIYHFDFNPFTNVEYEDAETGEIIEEEVELNNIESHFILPYFPNATLLEVFSPNLRKIAEYNLEEFSNIPLEESKDVLIENKSQNIKSDIKKTTQEKKQSSKTLIETVADNLWILILIIIILLIVFFYMITKKSKLK